jgi:hypothetical protein
MSLSRQWISPVRPNMQTPATIEPQSSSRKPDYAYRIAAAAAALFLLLTWLSA